MTSPTPGPDTPVPPPDVNAEQQLRNTQSSETTQQARDLADTLKQEPQNSVLFVKGVIVPPVVNPGTPPTVSVQMEGDTTTTIANVRFMDHYSPVSGDVVVMSRQGSGELLVWGQMADASDNTESGWTAPSLGSGFTTFANDPVLYRMVVDNGTNKIQLRGRVDVSGSPSALWTMPTGMRPLFNKAPILLPRSFGEGSTVCQMDVNANGTMVLVGGTVGIKDVETDTAGSGQTGWTTPANTGVTDTNHKHESTDIGTCDASSWTNWIVTGPVSHAHGSAGHDHSVGSHSHTTTPTAVGFPTFVSFNGVEYFL